MNLLYTDLPQAAACLAMLRECTERLGAVRDAEVMLELASKYQSKLPEQPDISQLVITWKQQYDSARQQLLAYLQQGPFHELESLLRTVRDTLIAGIHQQEPDELAATIKRHIKQCLSRVLSYRSCMESASLAELHRLRIRIKRLRYALEAGGELLKIGFDCLPLLADIQTRLGTMHDYAVILDILEPGGVPLENYAPFRGYCMDELSAAYRQFLVLWPQFTDRTTLGRLRLLINEQ